LNGELSKQYIKLSRTILGVCPSISLLRVFIKLSDLTPHSGWDLNRVLPENKSNGERSLSCDYDKIKTSIADRQRVNALLHDRQFMGDKIFLRLTSSRVVNFLTVNTSYFLSLYSHSGHELKKSMQHKNCKTPEPVLTQYARSLLCVCVCVCT